jgi:enamine deaminase RidA (YjgF/YER057c/UK114 family)
LSRKSKFAAGEGVSQVDPSLFRARVTRAGGMVYVTSVGPVDPETRQVAAGGIKEQTAQCLRNLRAKLEAESSSLERVVWVNWALRDPADFDAFNKEWARWFSGDALMGQGTLMPPLQRRAGFRVSIGVIAEAT